MSIDFNQFEEVYPVEDIAALSAEYDLASPARKQEIVFRCLLFDVDEIMRIAGDLDNPRLFADLHSGVLVHRIELAKDVVSEFHKIKKYQSADVYRAIRYFNCELAIYMIQLMGGKLDVLHDEIEQFIRDYRRFESDAALLKLVTLYPFVEISDSDIVREIEQIIKKNDDNC